MSLSGKIDNQHTDSIIIFQPKTDYRKVIKLKKDGSFSDTLAIDDGLFSYSDGRDFTFLYLEGGDEVKMDYDTEDFYQTIYFTGDNADENNFLAESVDNENAFLLDTKLMRLPQEEFDKRLNTFIDDFFQRLKVVNADEAFKTFETEEINSFKEYVTKSYTKINYKKIVLGKGKPSPEFTNYKKVDGSTASLNDLKGKYTYIDVWATWCNPCKDELPFLETLEKHYEGKNLQIIAIAIDDKKEFDTWVSMVNEKNVAGTQLFANGDTNFADKYRIASIPRFILLDPNGNIVEAYAPKPSDPKIVELFNSVL